MVSHDDVLRWCERAPTPGSPVLSVCLDVDQAHAANLNRGFESALRTALRAAENGLAESERAAFRADAARVERWVAQYTPRAKTLVVFADDSEDLFWTAELHTSAPTQVRWEPTPWVRPLVEAFARHEPYAVALVEKQRARVVTVRLGRIEESREALAPAEIRRKKASGTDHWRSQMQFQRQDETHVQWHLREVADLLEETVRTSGIERVVVAGPVEATSELLRMLPRALAERVVGTVRLPAEATDEQLLAETRAVADEAERASQEARVGQVFEGGVVGLEATLRALQEGRVRTLLWADGFESRGGECPRCHALFPADPGTACAYCGASLLSVDDLVGRAVARAVAAGAGVDRVAGPPAVRLLDAGGIGAVLRY